MPLLSVGARLATAIFEERPVSFTRLLSDGDLLVLAVVIAASAVGDLIFDPDAQRLNQGGDVGFARGLTIAWSLVVIVASGLLFGLSTSETSNQDRDLQKAQQSDGQLISQASALERKANGEQRMIIMLALKRQREERQLRLEAKNNGIDSTLRASVLKVTTRHEDLIHSQVEQRHEATAMSRPAIADLGSTKTGDAKEHHRSALISLIMFTAALIAAAAAVFLAAPFREADGSVPTAPTPQERLGTSNGQGESRSAEFLETTPSG